MRGLADCFAIVRWGLVVVSAVMLAGHVCVLPTYDHLETAPWHAEGAPPHDVDEAVHAASCEALPSSGVACPGAPTISSAVVATPLEHPKGWTGSASLSAPPTASPPFFLLHAAFLI